MTPECQLPMFFEPSSRDRYTQFRHDNPHVEAELVKLARQLISRGHQKYSIKALFEITRWHRALQTTDEDFKLNNNYAPYYARDLMDEYPDLEGFFNLRAQKSEW